VNLDAALRFARRWLPLLLLGPLVGGLAGHLVVRQVPPVYEATVTLLVGQGITSTNPGSDELNGAGQLAQTYAEAVRTRPVLAEAAAQQGLSLSIRELQERVQARRVPNTQLMRISAQSTYSSEAAALANAVASVFVAKNLEVQASRFASSRESLGRLVDSLQSDMDARAREIDVLRAQPPSPDRDTELSRLQSELTQLQATHSATVRSYEDLRVTEARGMNTLAILEPAVAPDEPVRPNPRLALFLAVLGGLVVAVGTAALIEYLDDALRDRRRVTTATGLPTLGLVPRGDSGISLRDPGSRRITESYRLLRSNIIALSAGRGLGNLVVASPSAGEGKSITAANLAVTLAEAGQRVILVDADMHRPTQMRHFNVPNRRGLATLLVDSDQSAEALLQPTWLANLRMLPAGPTPPEPSALLSSKRLDEVLGQLSQLSDVVVFDTPPLLAQPDAVLLGTRADGVLMVVDASKSRGRQFIRGLEMLRESGAPVLGAVLNRIPKQSVEYTAYEDYYGQSPERAHTEALVAGK